MKTNTATVEEKKPSQEDRDRIEREAPPGAHLLTRKMLQERVPVSAMTLWRWTRSGAFPEPLRIRGRNYWIKHEVDECLASQKRERCRSPRRGDRQDDGAA